MSQAVYRQEARSTHLFFFFLLIPFLRLNLRASRVPRLTSSSPSPRDQNLPAGKMPVPFPVRPVSPLLAPLGLDEASICAEGLLGSVGWLRSRSGGWGAIKQSRRIGFPGTAGLALPCLSVRILQSVRMNPLTAPSPSFTSRPAPRRDPYKKHLMVLCVFLGLRIRSATRAHTQVSLQGTYLSWSHGGRTLKAGWVRMVCVCACAACLQCVQLPWVYPGAPPPSP